MGMQIHGCQLLVGDFHLGGIEVGVEVCLYSQPCLSCRCPDEIDNDLVAHQGSAPPIHGDVRECSRVPYSLNGERRLSKALDSPIDGRTRESGKTGDAGNIPSSQLLCIDGSDKVLLSLIQVWKQQAVFLLKFFCCAHTDSVTQCTSFVTIINLRDLTSTGETVRACPPHLRKSPASVISLPSDSLATDETAGPDCAEFLDGERFHRNS